MQLYFWEEFILNLFPRDQKLDSLCPFPHPILCACIFLAILSILFGDMFIEKKKKTGSGHSKMKLTSQHISLAGFYSLTLPHSIDCTDVVQDCYYRQNTEPLVTEPVTQAILNKGQI